MGPEKWSPRPSAAGRAGDGKTRFARGVLKMSSLGERPLGGVLAAGRPRCGQGSCEVLGSEERGDVNSSMAFFNFCAGVVTLGIEGGN